MKIEEEYTSFTGHINIGHLARFIKISETGYDTSVKDVVERIKNFYCNVLYGNPFLEKTDVPLLVKQVLKFNPNAIFKIYSNTLVKPIGIGSIDSIEYFTNVPLKISGIHIEKRIKSSIIKWFIDVHAKFIFEVVDTDDIDEVFGIINMAGIPKRLTYLSPVEGEALEFVLHRCVKYKFNFAPNFKKFLWNNFGRDNIVEGEKDGT